MDSGSHLWGALASKGGICLLLIQERASEYYSLLLLLLLLMIIVIAIAIHWGWWLGKGFEDSMQKALSVSTRKLKNT